MKLFKVGDKLCTKEKLRNRALAIVWLELRRGLISEETANRAFEWIWEYYEENNTRELISICIEEHERLRNPSRNTDRRE